MNRWILAALLLVGLVSLASPAFADTFCIDPQPIEPGSTISFEVSGRLTDPGQYGTVWAESGFCVGGYDYRETVVLPPAVGDGAESWSTLKASFR